MAVLVFTITSCDFRRLNSGGIRIYLKATSVCEEFDGLDPLDPSLFNGVTFESHIADKVSIVCDREVAKENAQLEKENNELRSKLTLAELENKRLSRLLGLKE